MSRRVRKKSSDKSGKQVFWISVSDLMAATVFVFLIVIAVFSLQFEQEQKMFLQTKSILKSSIKTRHKILTDIKQLLRKNGLNSEILTEQGILRIQSDMIGFPASEASPNLANLANIGILSKVLSQVLPCYATQKPAVGIGSEFADWCEATKISHTAFLDNSSNQNYQCGSETMARIDTIMIEGHTDPTPVKASASYPDNLTLSAMRAGNVWKLMNQCQPSLGELFNDSDHQIFGVSGYAFLRPAYPDENDPRNRRIDIRFVMEQPKEAFAEDLPVGNFSISKKTDIP